VYPLVEWGWTKEMVRREVASWPFALELPGEHHGNCDLCFKKSLRKLYTLALENPDYFDWYREMERKYSFHKACSPDKPRRFFRGHRSADDILREARGLPDTFVPYSDTPIAFDPELDVQAACGESCEIGADQ
jgi:hypothetical protein